MNFLSQISLHQKSFSLEHEEFIRILSNTENILIIQDLDGVCMGLVKDPLTRTIDVEYVKASKSFIGHFYVLTNGEHIGTRGVNGIIERAFAKVDLVKKEGLYLPGLGAGGVQWQDIYGNISHPGVTEQELDFLAIVYQRIILRLREFFQQHPHNLTATEIEEGIQTAVLDNLASPTANLNVFYEKLANNHQLYLALQQDMEKLMQKFLLDATQQGLTHSFFVHYAPNLGRDQHGQEIMRPATNKDSGTTDFQFMLQGAIKEAGVLVILNKYYFQQTGKYPLGEDFHVRKAPRDRQALLELVINNFEPQTMPLIIGVGDTVTSTVQEEDGEIIVRRGGSDRNFLQLIQDIGTQLNHPNLVVYVDSSDGEVKNRKPLKLETIADKLQVIEGPGDAKDKSDPLTLNLVFPGGYQEYLTCFKQAAKLRQSTLFT